MSIAGKLQDIDAILIAGPTASGKSALALAAAKELNGVIVNADSMQVYDALRLLTARPSDEDEAAIEHVLYGFVPPNEAYSTGCWVDDTAKTLATLKAEQRLPIIVGGTGLYFAALLKGLSPIPAIPDHIRCKWRAAAKECPSSELYATLENLDPAMAALLRPSDPQRIVRALEVLEGTGKSLKDWQNIPGKPLLDFARVRAFVAAPDRDILYARCAVRFDHMIKAGAVDEVAALMALDLGSDLPIMRALGVSPLRQYLTGHLTLDEACEQAKTDTRRYAKRQMTWVRGNMIAWKWLSAQDIERFAHNSFLFCEV